MRGKTDKPFTTDEINKRLWEIAVANPVMDLAQEVAERGLDYAGPGSLSGGLDPCLPDPLKLELDNAICDAKAGYKGKGTWESTEHLYDDIRSQIKHKRGLWR